MKGYTVTGVCSKLSDTQLEITELPVGKWTRDYKTFLEELAQKEELDEIAEYHTENRVHFVVSSHKLVGVNSHDELVRRFKLQSSLPATNFVLFSAEGKIVKY